MDSASRLIQEQKANLEGKVKALESALKKIESEKRILEDNIGVSLFYLPLGFMLTLSTAGRWIKHCAL